MKATLHPVHSAVGFRVSWLSPTLPKGPESAENTDKQKREGLGLRLTPALCTLHKSLPCRPGSISSPGGRCTQRFRVSFPLQCLVILQGSGSKQSLFGVNVYWGHPGRRMIQIAHLNGSLFCPVLLLPKACDTVQPQGLVWELKYVTGSLSLEGSFTGRSDAQVRHFCKHFHKL